MRIITIILLSIFIYAFFFYLQNYEPDRMKAALVQVDVWGWTTAARQEQVRRAQIQALDIPYEQKKVLMDRTVFIGASDAMVELALGKPSKVLHWQEKSIPLDSFTYYLPGDMRPTIFVFQQKQLIKAYKGSALNAAPGNS